ncbi:hypothetical protein UMM65_01990 [Aureibaculum sp. 2210JD6-5]|uniref:hypothetical protein n=1 Tax=Aureibaculum sp. 2210JD6-5 TaxID=3103957 RepID=UPI002AACA2FF|nr:hypothetical protein [Aureibaculum sp. 2210JD6-5]MDY7393999.1 hypothetical protein [Aureibaculum sp. 2210JD6-5]
MLQNKFMSIYCVLNDILLEMNHKEHSNRKVSYSQVLTTAIVADLYFGGNQTMVLLYLKNHIFKDTIDKSGFTKWLHKLKELLMFIFLSTGRIFKHIDCNMKYNLGSFPVKVCHNIRIGWSISQLVYQLLRYVYR